MAQGTPSSKPGLAIGIDLGTTYSCVAVYRKGAPRTVENDSGNRTTPSWVRFTETSYVVGETAKTVANKNAVYDSKRMLGRRYDDPILQEDMKRWPFRVVNVDNEPKIAVEAMTGKAFSPEEISSYILRKLKERVEKKFDAPVIRAVVTVPAYFNHSQRKATMDAARLAGLESVRLFSEPLAAALAYGEDQDENFLQGNILVFDLGGGTLDLSVVNINQGTYDVKAINGNTHLGGEDFTNHLYDHVMEEFQKKGVVIPLNMKSEMREKCDMSKKILSNEQSTEIYYCNHTVSVSRAKFEDLNRDLFAAINEPLRQVLQDAKLRKSEIDEVVMTGGSVRIPKVIDKVQEFFEGKPLNNFIDVDEAVAHGAAIQAAALLDKDQNPSLRNLIILDVTPLSLGVETFGGGLSVVVRRNSRIPLTETSTFTTAKDYQTSADFCIYEGERPLAKDNTLLGRFVLSDIPSALRGVPQLDTAFKIDLDGILTVSTTLRGSLNSKQIEIRKEGRMSAAQIIDSIQQANEMKSLDEQIREKIAAKNELERLIYNIRSKVNSASLSCDNKQRMLGKCDSALQWMEGKELFEIESHDKKRSDKLYTKEEYEDQLRELNRECLRLKITL